MGSQREPGGGAPPLSCLICGTGHLYPNSSRVHSPNTGARAKSEMKFSCRAPPSQELSPKPEHLSELLTPSIDDIHSLERATTPRVGSGAAAPNQLAQKLSSSASHGSI